MNFIIDLHFQSVIFSVITLVDLFFSLASRKIRIIANRTNARKTGLVDNCQVVNPKNDTDFWKEIKDCVISFLIDTKADSTRGPQLCPDFWTEQFTVRTQSLLQFFWLTWSWWSSLVSWQSVNLWDHSLKKVYTVKSDVNLLKRKNWSE